MAPANGHASNYQNASPVTTSKELVFQAFNVCMDLFASKAILF